MKSRIAGLIVALALGLLASPLAADAQQAGKVPRIGVLCAVGCACAHEARPECQALVQGLRELGYVDGQNIVVDTRAGGVGYDRLADSAANFLRLNVDVILAAEGSAAALAARNATSTVPIVLAEVPDAVELGLVASLARPGGNITGLTFPFAELAAKQLELLKEAVPGLSRVAVLWNPANPEHGPALKEIEIAGRAMGVQLQPLEARSARDFERVFSAMSRGRAGALLVLADPVLYGGQLKLLAIRSRMPTISLRRQFVAGGGLMAYGPNLPDMYRRAAAYVDKILKGARPGNLPVEQPMRFELVINLTTAKALGLTIPRSVLLRADEVIQ